MTVTRQQSIQSQSIRHLDELTKINSLLFLIRYKDSQKIIESKDQSYLKSLCQMMLLGYGFNNSAKGNGLFIDSYCRAGDDSYKKPAIKALAGIAPHRRQSLLGSLSALLDREEKALLISEVETTRLAPKKITIEGRELLYTSDYDKSSLGTLGLIENKDAQLWAYANETLSGISFKDKLKRLIYEINLELKPHQIDDLADKIAYIPSIMQDEIIKNNIIQMLNPHSFFPKQSFYISLLKKLISGLKISDLQNPLEAEQVHLAMSRLEFVIKNAIKNIQNFELFITYIEFAIDEINFLLMLSQAYNQHDIRNSLDDYLDEQFSHHRPDGILLGGSGMQVITTLITEAILESKYDTNIFIQKGSYFEILLAMDSLLGFDFPVKRCADYHHQVLDLIVTSFHRNCSLSNAGFRGSNVQKVIDEQLELRKGLDRKLIVMIDTTMDSFDHFGLSALLEKYKKYIESGQLAIITAHSLNKYFHMGLDKIAAGLATIHYNPMYFPHFEALLKKSWLGGFLPSDPTLQLITHFTKYAKADISEYFRLIMRSAKHIHDKCLPKSLYDAKDNLVTIDYPYTSDDAHDIWGFVAVRLHPTMNEELREEIVNNISRLLTTFGVKFREGFGFSTTSQMYLSEDPSVIRISLGMEPVEQLETIFKPFFKYLLEMNMILKSHNKNAHQLMIKQLTSQYIAQTNNRPASCLFQPAKAMVESEDIEMIEQEKDQYMNNRKSKAREY